MQGTYPHPHRRLANQAEDDVEVAEAEAEAEPEPALDHGGNRDTVDGSETNDPYNCGAWLVHIGGRNMPGQRVQVQALPGKLGNS